MTIFYSATFNPRLLLSIRWRTESRVIPISLLALRIVL